MNPKIETRIDSQRGCGWTQELAWAAGFFDGEGSAYMNRKHGRISAPHMTITQVESEPLYRFQRAMGGMGKIYGPYKRQNKNQQEQYNYRLYGFEGVQAAVAMLWNFLCGPKRQQLSRILIISQRLPTPRTLTGSELAAFSVAARRKAAAQ